ncbi:major facilitator superfamily domain-containing protein [Schizothecium vesticola]|uniref:Major facilitator superfamily domain-containing protein n=1 Tax=Schizothecium vesticola TaxID=314040 RepID=A0AA40EHD3_9PEZI|nr:major facilitator superfamily domain-containing protein [Schizothecium vesticola]
MSQTATTQINLQPLSSPPLLNPSPKLDNTTPQTPTNTNPTTSSEDAIRPALPHSSSTPEAPPGITSQAKTTYLTPSRSSLLVTHLTLVIAMASVSTGLITTSIPRMASDLSIPPQTSYWPLSVYGLTSGACLLVSGAIADVVGSNRVFSAGNLLLGCFMFACGLARTNVQVVMARAMQGVAVALCFPSSVGIIARSVVPGQRRNLAFACTGLGQVLGYFAGLLFGGLFIDTVGWRVGWYVTGSVLVGLFVFGVVWVLPADGTTGNLLNVGRELRTKVDWVGAGLASASLALLAYVLVQLSNSELAIRAPVIVAMLAVSLGLMPVFVAWTHFAEKRGYPVLIPNRLWKETAFVGVCVMMLLSYAVMQTMELFCTLFFQHVQGLSAMQSSVRMVPAMVVATLMVLTTGLFIHKISPVYLVLPTSFLCAGAPLLMALNQPEWPYWYAAFPAQALQPMSADVLFSVGIIVVSEVFPDDTQAVAGAVFNTAGQFGLSIGLALIGIVSESFIQRSPHADKSGPEALADGYRAAFWTAFGWMLLICVVALVSLRKVERVGLKRD